MHKSSAYAAKFVILSLLSRRPNRLSKYVFHNMGPSMEPCGHPRLIFLFAMHSDVLICTSRIEADCRREGVFEGPLVERRVLAKTCGRKHRRSQRTSPSPPKWGAARRIKCHCTPSFVKPACKAESFHCLEAGLEFSIGMEVRAIIAVHMSWQITSAHKSKRNGKLPGI
ncbi:hypothetical protein HN011_012418 [Eciton burchellii]|nr:hypothetical protein HN011_012418 [Eciton burchellii]